MIPEFDIQLYKTPEDFLKYIFCDCKYDFKNEQVEFIKLVLTSTEFIYNEIYPTNTKEDFVKELKNLLYKYHIRVNYNMKEKRIIMSYNNVIKGFLFLNLLNGIVFDFNYNVLCVPSVKLLSYNNSVSNPEETKFLIEDGVLINFYFHNEKWNIGNSKSDNLTKIGNFDIRDLIDESLFNFKEIYLNEFLDKLDKNFTHVFIFKNPKIHWYGDNYKFVYIHSTSKTGEVINCDYDIPGMEELNNIENFDDNKHFGFISITPKGRYLYISDLYKKLKKALYGNKGIEENMNYRKFIFVHNILRRNEDIKFIVGNNNEYDFYNEKIQEQIKKAVNIINTEVDISNVNNVIIGEMIKNKYIFTTNKGDIEYVKKFVNEFVYRSANFLWVYKMIE